MAQELAPVKSPVKSWLETGAVSEHRVVLTEKGISCGSPPLEIPPYNEWFQSRGISQAEFNELMTEVIKPMSEFQEIVGISIMFLVCTGGIGFCPLVFSGMSKNSKVDAILDAFNSKHPNLSSKHAEDHGRIEIVFRAPASSESGVAAAVPVVAPAVMVRDSKTPTEKLTELKSLLDGGLITQAEFDSKKAEVLAGF